MNVFLLGCRFAASPWWMTFRQALERGGHVRKGERGALVVKCGTFNLKESKQSDRDDEEQRKGMFLRGYTVFNATQIEGIQFPEAVPCPALSADQRNISAEAIVKAMPQSPVIHAGRSTRARYSPKLDEVEMPAFDRFESGEAYYSTLFHELAHATGHPTRLNRDSLAKHDGFGGQVYLQKELVAEPSDKKARVRRGRRSQMAAAFVGMEADIVKDRHEQSAAHLGGWLAVLKAKDHRRDGRRSQRATFQSGGHPSNPLRLTIKPG
jgi:antirestriction protein ArdC